MSKENKDPFELPPEPAWQVDGMEIPGLEWSGKGHESTQAGPNKWESSEGDSPVSLARIVEALLFVGGEPLTAEQVAQSVRGVTQEDFVDAIDGLNRAYRSQGRPYLIRAGQRGYELALRPRYFPLQEKLAGLSREARLSQAALDVLALIAYRQPMTKKDVDSLRGMESGSLLRQLVRRGLLMVGESPEGGRRDAVYRTTQRFVDLFQLSGLEDLPRTHDLQRL
jgi:segregation and condensation protein B